MKQGLLFLDDQGVVWVTHSPAGTGQYFWWCRENETDYRKEFDVSYIEERVENYQIYIEKLQQKLDREAKVFNFIKKISSQIVRKEILREEEWSDEQLSILNTLIESKFSIEMDNDKC